MTKPNRRRSDESEDAPLRSDLVNRLINYAFLAVPVGLLLFCLSTIWSHSNKGAAMQAWPETTGTVMFSDITETTSFHRKTGTRTERDLSVQYNYTVNGVSYTGSKYGLDKLSGGRAGAEAVDARFPPGVVVPVYYNPAQPSEALLDRTPASNILWWIFAAGAGYGSFYILRMAIDDENEMSARNAKKSGNRKNAAWKSKRDTSERPLPPIVSPAPPRRKPRPL